MSRVEYREDGKSGILMTDHESEWIRSDQTVEIEDWR